MAEKKLQPHIKLRDVDNVCFLAGNPDRIPLIASFLKDAQKIASHRGLIAYKGVTPRKKIPVTVLTTGMGCPSTAIVLEEAYKAGGRVFIRIGSTGSLLTGENYSIGSIYIPIAAIRDDGASLKLAPSQVPAVASHEIFQALCQAAEELEVEFHNGLVWTSDIYYNEDPNTFQKWVKYGATCVEMETSLLFTVGLMKGLKMGTILTSDGNLNESDSIYVGSVEENHKKFEAGVVNTIKCAISAVELLK